MKPHLDSFRHINEAKEFRLRETLEYVGLWLSIVLAVVFGLALPALIIGAVVKQAFERWLP